MKDITTAAQVALEALGDTAEKVALTLLNGGWHGPRHDSGACPIARYLEAVLSDVIGVAVGSDEVTIHSANGITTEVSLTPAVAGFVLAFDIGVFPKLIDEDNDVRDL